MTTRKIQFQRVLNFRDMGGLTTLDGRTVKKGLLFRCGELGNATDEDIKTLEALQLKIIFDYRDQFEAESNVTPVLKNVKNIRIPALKNNSSIPTANIGELIKTKTLYQPDLFRKFYAEIVFDNPSYQTLLNIFCSTETPLLHHCSAGKDRTGIGTALIYLLLGVSEEQIIKDYLRTNDELQSKRTEWFATIEERGEKRLKQYALAKEEYIRAVFSAIKQRYGNYKLFFEKEYGITQDQIDKVRNYYLH